MEVKDIQGKTLIDAPITESAVITEELMKQYSITLGWDAISADVLPLGSYIEHNGVRYSLLAPYSPQQRDETTYEYKPVFEHPVMRWQYLPFFHYTYSGGSIVSKEPDWSLTDNAANFMAAVCAAIKEQTGEDWSYEIADNLPASGDLSFSNTDIFSALTSIAGKFETEWWFDYARKTIYLSKASHGSEVSLEVGRNIGIPSTTQSRDSYATRFYVFGSTRNIEQNYAGSNVNSIVNKRLTLNPAKYPNGYIDIREGLTDSEILVKTLTFDDVYPRSALTISDLKVRLMWRLDSDNQKVQIGTDANGNAVYDQYAIWYFKVPGFSFNKDMVISGKALSVHFNDGPLSGREFELTYHDKDKDVETSDGTSIHVDAGSFEINFVEEGTYIIPSITGLVPVEGNKVTLFNIRMPDEYKSFAYDELEKVAKKEIAKQNEDLSNYSFNSNPVDFFMNNPGLSVGQKVVYKNGSYSYSTRVIKLETQLDRPYEQKITIGSEQIKGNTQTLKEDVVSANQNIDLIASINESTQQLVQSYQKTQKALQESMAVWGNLWKLDPANNAVRTPFNLISDGTIAMKQLGVPGDSEIIGGIQRVRVYFGEDTDYIDSDANGNIRLPAYPTALKNPHALKINGVAYDGSKDIEINISANGGIADSVAWENVFGRPTNLSEFTDDLTPSIQEWVIGKHYLTSIPDEYVTDTELNNKGYATENWVSAKGYAVATSVANTYATKTALESANTNISNLGTKVATIEKTIETEQGYIDILQGYFTNGIANNASKLNGQLPSYYATSDSLNNLGGRVDTLYGYFANGVANNAAKLDGQLPSYYATAASVTAIGNRAAALEGYFNNGIAKEAAKVTQSLTFGKKTYNGSSAQSILASDLDAVTIAGAQTITGAKTFSAQLTANEGILVPKGKSVKIGGSELVWDDTMQALKIIGSAYVTGTIAMKQLSKEGTEGGGGTGGATAAIRIMLGEEPYDAKNGVISLPAYPVIPASLKNPYSLTFGTKSYDGSAAKTITASDLGALTAHQDISHLLSKKDAVSTYQTIISASNKIAYSNISGTPTSLPASDVSAWAKKSALAIDDVPDLSSKYLSVDGGLLTGGLTIKNASGNSALYLGEGGAVYYNPTEDTTVLYSSNTGYPQLKVKGGVGYPIFRYNYVDNVVIHSGNYEDTTDKRYLKFSGGTLGGALRIQGDSADLLQINRMSDVSTTYITFLGNETLRGRIGFNADLKPIVQDVSISSDNQYLIHSGNIKDYALKTDGTNSMGATSYIRWATAEGIEDYSVYNNGIKLLSYNAGSGNYRGGIHIGTRYGWQLTREAFTETLQVRFRKTDTTTWNNWKTIAFTDSNVASATKLANSRTIWGQNFDGTADITGTLRLYNSNGYCANIIGNTNGIYLETWLDNVKYLPIMLNPNGGNVLIGTTTDSGTKLYVNGDVRFDGQTMISGSMRFYGKTNLSSDMYIDNQSVGGLNFAWSDGVSRFFIGDKVGIGTSNPQYKLDVNGNLRASSIIPNADTTNDIGTNSAQYRYIYASWLGSKTGTNLWLAANDGYHLCINYLGNVTIGSSELASSNYKLYIDGAGEMLNLSNRNGGEAGLRFSRGNNTSWSVIVRSGNLYITENHSNTTRLLLYEGLQGGGADFAGSIKATSLKLGSATLSYNDKGWLEISGNVVVKGTLGMLELGEGGSASGASGRLVDLTDVTIATPLQGQALIYDEKNGWINGIAGINQAELNQALASYALLTDVDNRINALINGAPAAYDTLKEIADVLAGNVNSIGDILTALDTKANKAIKISAGTGLTGGGTLEADRTLSLAVSGVTAGTYRSVTVDTYGRVTAGTNPTTLSDYGITDAKIADGVITLGANTIKPLTSHQSISHLLSKDDASKTYQPIISLTNMLSFDYISSTPTTLLGYGIEDFIVSLTVNSLDDHTDKAGIYRLGSVAPDNHGYGNAITLRHLKADTFGQIYISCNNNIKAGGLYWRGGTNNTTPDWKKVLDTNNYTDYVYTEGEIDSKLSGYLPKDGGVMSGYIAWQSDINGNDIADWLAERTNFGIKIMSSGGKSTGTPSDYATALQVRGRYGFQIASIGGGYDIFYIKNISSENRSWKEIIHSGNIANQSVASATKATQDGNGNVIVNTYLPKSGGTIEGSYGALSIKRNNAYASLIKFENTSGAMGYLGFNSANIPIMYTEDASAPYTLLHENNYSSYALPLSGGILQADSADLLVINRLSSTNTAYITFKGNNSLRGRLGFNADGLPIVQVPSISSNNLFLIHSGNISEQSVSYANNAGNASTLNGYDQYGFYRSAKQGIPSGDLALLVAGSYYAGGFAGDTNPLPTTYASLSVFGQSYYSSHLCVEHNASRAWLRGVYNTSNGVSATDWHEIAFKDGNIASATKLQTPRTIWGRSFDGTADISGILLLNNGVSIQTKDSSGVNRDVVYMTAANHLVFGSGAHYVGGDTYIGGKNLNFRYGTTPTIGMVLNSSGNVTIGASDLASTTAKLFVEGVAKIGNTIELIGGTSASARLVVKEVGGDKNFIHMYVDTNNETTGRALVLQNGYGNVGIGTPNPQYKLDVNGNLRASSIIPNADTTNDIGTNSAQYRYIYASWLGSKTGTNLWLAANNAYHLCINTYGNVTIGTSDLAVNNYKLYVNGDTRVSSLTVGSSKLSYNTNGWLSVDTSFVSEKTIGMRDLVNTSDRRLKADIEEISEEKSLSIVRKLRPSTWTWKKDGKVSFGLIAQDVEPIIPAMVVEINSYKHLQYTMLHAFELGAIKKIDSDVEKLKEDLKIANNRIEKLESELKQYRQWQ